MINVLMDHQTFDLQKYGGISRYFANIYHYLKNDPRFKSEISILKTDNFYLKDDSFSKNPLIKLALKRHKKQIKYNREFSLSKIGKNNFDILHPTYYDPYFLENLKKPFVLTVHDMIHEVYPEFFAPYDNFAKFKRLTINKADHIIAISEATKLDLQNFYEVPEEKITVVYHGVKIQNNQQQPILDGIEIPYILFVGDRAGYKNFYRFIKAFKEISLIHKDIKLICTGSIFSPVEQEFLTRSKITDKIIQVNVTDEELNGLYQNALFYISPSLMEGFGFPILEAFANKCLTLLSNIKSFREIAGDSAIYFDPFSIDDIARAMGHAIQSESTKRDFIAKGEKQLLKFPIEKSMQKTKEVYEHLSLHY